MHFPRILPLFAWFVLSAVPLHAQSTSANINGLVSDSSTAAIGDAEVVAVSDVTGVQYLTKTNSEGIYVLPNLPAGPYRLQVSKVGFKTVIKPDIVLNIQDALSINFTLPVGAAYEVLTVEGGAPLVNTESAAVSTVIDHSYVENMPLNGRSFQDLILLTPGAETQTPQVSLNYFSGNGMTGEFSVNGQRPESNYYTVDGVSANVGINVGVNSSRGAGITGSTSATTALGTTQALASVDDLQEFRVQSSSYSAEYGRNPGGQFAFQTKSGTDQFHGTAYDYLRNGVFDAQDWFNDYFAVKQPAIRQNDFGGTVGGPIRKDRIFAFVSYEGLRLVAPEPASITFVPDASLRESSPVPLNQAMNAYPAPNGPEVTVPCNPATDPSCPSTGQKQDGLAENIASWSNPASLDATSARFDYALSNKLRAFFRFGNTTSNSVTRGTSAGFLTPATLNTVAYTLRTYTAGVSSTFSSRLSNELRLNYTKNAAEGSSATRAFAGSTPVDLTQITGLGQRSMPIVAIAYDGYDASLQEDQAPFAQRQWNFVDTLGLSFGRHQLRFGVDGRRLAPLATQASPFLEYFYLSESAVETNDALIFNQNNANAYPLYWNYSAYAQDDWKITQRMSLALGLRWEVNPAPGATQGFKPYTVLGSSANTWDLAPQGTPLWRTGFYNFAPRLGIVYAFHNRSNRETVLRIGGGVFYDTGQQLGSLGFNDAPGFSAFTFASGPFPGTPSATVPAIINPPVRPYSSRPTGFAAHLQLPYTLQWNASIEQALGQSQSLTVSYVGSHAARLLKETDIETPNNPNASEFLFVGNGLKSDYDSLQIQLKRRLSQGLTALGSYTMSHCIDYGSQNYFFGYQRGNCDFDVRHNFSAAFSYDLPTAGLGWLDESILRHWGVDGRVSVRSSFPVTLSGPTILGPSGQQYNAGLNLVSGQPIYLYGTNCAAILQSLGDLSSGQGCPGGRVINPQAFTNVNSGFGDAPRNFVNGFGAWQMDFTIRREFPIHEQFKLQFRAEAFNILNHPNFGTINSSFGQSAFGQATATLANSLGILNPLYQQGGSRSMQFTLRLAF